MIAIENTLETQQMVNARMSEIGKRLEQTKLDIAGEKYSIIFEPNLIDRHKCAGYADIFGNEIHVEEATTDHAACGIVMHEVVELISRKFELAVPHRVITAMAMALNNTLISSPDFLKAMLNIHEGSKISEEEVDQIIEQITGQDKAA